MDFHPSRCFLSVWRDCIDASPLWNATNVMIKLTHLKLVLKKMWPISRMIISNPVQISFWIRPLLMGYSTTLWPPCFVMANVLDCGIVVSDIKFQLCYYVHFRTNNLGKDINPFVPPVMVSLMARENWVQSPGQVIPKTQKMVLDPSLLNTQHYKVRIKGKVEQSGERSSALPYELV